MTFTGFIEPDRTLEDLADPAEALNIPLMAGYRAADGANPFYGRNRIFDRIFARQQLIDLKYEDQCSGQYYFDLVSTLRDFNGHYDRVAEVGVFMGGSSAFIADCTTPFDFDLDMIDVNLRFLKFAYERVRRVNPENAKRIRLFHGDLPSYVRHVIMRERGHSYIVHHDGAHNFEQVVKDLASLYYVQESITALIAQDTHLRGSIKNMNFVDLALHAVFGPDLNFAPIGTSYSADSPITTPNKFEGNYFMPGAPEGLVIPMAMNTFRYPHPQLSIDDFLPPPAQTKEPALIRLMQMQAAAE